MDVPEYNLIEFRENNEDYVHTAYRLIDESANGDFNAEELGHVANYLLDLNEEKGRLNPENRRNLDYLWTVLEERGAEVDEDLSELREIYPSIWND